MAIIPIELMFLALVPGNIVQVSDQPIPGQMNRPVALTSFQNSITPRLPSPKLPLAIDAQGRVYDAVLPAFYEAPSAESESEIFPSTQTLTPVDVVPVFVPSSQDKS